MISKDVIQKWLEEEKQLFNLPTEPKASKNDWSFIVTKESVSTINIGIKKPKNRDTLEIFFYLDLDSDTQSAMQANQSDNNFVNELQLVTLVNNITLRITPNIQNPRRFWIYSNLYGAKFTKQDLFDRIHIVRNTAMKSLVVFRKHVQTEQKAPSYQFGMFPT